jgi:hypothetical protein
MNRLERNTNLGTRLGNGAEVVDHVSLGHTDTSISYVEHLVLLVRSDTDVEFLFGLQLSWIGEGGITNFVECIGSIGYQLSKEDLFVRVEGIYERGQHVYAQVKKKATY